MNTRYILCALMLLCGYSFAADQVFLKSGDDYDGTVIEDNGNTVVVKTTSGATRSFRRSDVDTIIYGKKPTGSAAEPAPAATAAGADTKKEGISKPLPVGEVGPEGTKADGTKADGTKKTDTAKADGTKTDDKTDAKEKGEKGEKTDAQKAAEEEEKAWKEWTPPPGLSSFPDHAKRMDKAKEQKFIEDLDKLANADTSAAAKGEILGMGKEVLPYVIAGCMHASADTRTACMKMLGQIPDNKAATKQAIEVFYAAMPTDGKAAWFQVQFIDAVKETLPIITGQTFITVQARDSLVQQGLKGYIDWYNANFQSLPPQLGEKKFDKTDADYVKKVAESRKLKLQKRDFPSPPAPSDLQSTPNKVNNRPPLNESTAQRESDKNYAKDFNNRVGRDDPLKRPQDKTNSGE
jgi:hypothetical protein